MYSVLYGISLLECRESLPIGKLIQLIGITLHYKILPHFSLKITNRIRIICYGKLLIKNVGSLKYHRNFIMFAKRIIKSLQQIARININPITNNSSKNINPEMFDSVTSLINNSCKCNGVHLLCELLEHGKYKCSDNYLNYIFHVKSENNIISIIKKPDCSIEHMLGHIPSLTKPFVFANVNLEIDKAKYFVIKPQSFLMHTFCTEIHNILLYGKMGTITINMDYIWPPSTIELNNFVIHKYTTVPHFDSITKAIKYLKKWNNFTTTADFTVCANNIINHEKKELEFRIYCLICDKFCIGLKSCHHKKGKRTYPFLHSNYMITWYDNTMCTENKTINNQVTIKSYEITITLQSIQNMYDYLKQTKELSNELITNELFFMKSFTKPTSAWKKTEQCLLYLPVMNKFWEIIKSKKGTKLQFNIKLSNGTYQTTLDTILT